MTNFVNGMTGDVAKVEANLETYICRHVIEIYASLQDVSQWYALIKNGT